jgi:hypothetical protein
VAPALVIRRGIEGSFEGYKKEQSRIARRRLYPLTIFYTAFAFLILALDVRSRHPCVGAVFFLTGLPVWSLIEYLFHRYVLHGRFPPGQGFIRKFLHERLDPLHWDHHERPFDGWHISGQLKDILPLFAVAVLFSFLLPVYTLLPLLAGVVQSYVGEEWLHYYLHFGKPHLRFLRYLKRYHLYHHSPRGIDRGYGITSGVWDRVFSTQYPHPVRKSILESSRAESLTTKKLNRAGAQELFRNRFKAH